MYVKLQVACFQEKSIRNKLYTSKNKKSHEKSNNSPITNHTIRSIKNSNPYTQAKHQRFTKNHSHNIQHKTFTFPKHPSNQHIPTTRTISQSTKEQLLYETPGNRGPTVERDMSDLANEAQEVTESTMKTMYDVSKVVAILGLSQLGIGAYLMTSSLNLGNLLVMSASAMAFVFPFSMALMMRHSLKAMHFFNKMEKIGRLQLLTSTMQIMKNLRVFFIRLRVIGYASVSGLLVSFVYSLFTTTSTTTSTATS